MMKITPGTYRHYKGGLYQILGLALHTETQEKMVLYQALYDCPDLESDYGKRPFFVRPYSMFTQRVEVNGEQKVRFERVE